MFGRLVEFLGLQKYNQRTLPTPLSPCASEISETSPGLVLAYDNDAHTDGAGAQLQRLLGIYAASKALGCQYLHTGLNRGGYQGLAVVESGQEIENLHELYNQLFKLPSTQIEEALFKEHIVHHKNPSIWKISRLRNQMISKKKWGLMLITYPFKVADQFPETYAVVQGLVNSNSWTQLDAAFYKLHSAQFNLESQNQLVVGVHVRRADLATIAKSRLLTIDYYVNLCIGIQTILHERGQSAVFDIFTEIPVRKLAFTGHHGGLNRASKRMVFKSDDVDLSGFSVLKNVRFRANEHQIPTIYNLCTADILVASRSSFSYVAAIAGSRKIVFYPPFWHSLLEAWIETDPSSGKFDHEKFRQALSNLTSGKPPSANYFKEGRRLVGDERLELPTSSV